MFLQSQAYSPTPLKRTLKSLVNLNYSLWEFIPWRDMEQVQDVRWLILSFFSIELMVLLNTYSEKSLICILVIEIFYTCSPEENEQ